MSKVTVVIPTKNNPESLDHTLKTLRESTNVDYELIIVDGNKQKFDTSIKAMNFGFKKAKNHVLLTHDDMSFPKLYKRDWLKEMIDLAENKDLGIITSLNSMGVSGDTFLDGFRWVGTWFMFVTKQCHEKIGYLDENYTTGDDIDYTYTAIKNGFNITMINYYPEHHMSNDRSHDKKIAETNIVKQNGDYFKVKHGI